MFTKSPTLLALGFTGPLTPTVPITHKDLVRCKNIGSGIIGRPYGLGGASPSTREEDLKEARRMAAPY